MVWFEWGAAGEGGWKGGNAFALGLERVGFVERASQMKGLAYYMGGGGKKGQRALTGVTSRQVLKKRRKGRRALISPPT